MLQAEVVQTKAFPAFRVNGELQTGLAFCTVARDLSADNREAAARRIAEFRDAGIHYYTFGLGLDAFMGQKSFWNGPNDYDYAVLDDLFGFVIAIDPAARILPRIALDAPHGGRKRIRTRSPSVGARIAASSGKSGSRVSVPPLAAGCRGRPAGVCAPCGTQLLRQYHRLPHLRRSQPRMVLWMVGHVARLRSGPGPRLPGMAERATRRQRRPTAGCMARRGSDL